MSMAITPDSRYALVAVGDSIIAYDMDLGGRVGYV